MKILIIHNTYQRFGGEDVVVQQEAELLRQYGHTVIEYRRSNREVEQLSLFQKAMLPKRMIWASDAVNDLQGLIVREKPDVAHFHNTHFIISPAAYYTCQREGIPVVQTLHNYRLLCPAAMFFRGGKVCEKCLERPLPWPSIVHACFRGSRLQTAGVASSLTFHRGRKTFDQQVDCYIAPTRFAREKFIQGGFSPDKVAVKPNFIYDLPALGGATGNDYALFIGRLSAEKGVQTLVKAWNSLGDIPLKIMGDGPEMNMLRQNSGVGESLHIEILGHQTKGAVFAGLKRARYLVFPSGWYESFPITLLEAFACSVPVVASRLGAMAEIVEDGKTGLHFEPGNAEDLAAKVRWAWEHPDEMAAMGKSARREYEEKYTAERNYELLMGIYERVIQRE